MSEVLEDSPYDGTSLLVHVILANHANDDGVCWPSIARIAKQCRVSERHVQRILATLEADGYLRRSQRPGRSNLFMVGVTPASGVLFDVGMTPTSGGDDARVTGGVTPTSPRKVKEPSRTSGPATRARDEFFDAVCEACGIDPLGPMTKDERGRINSASKQLRDIETTPDEIRKRAREYRRLYQNVQCTPQGLTGNWAQLSTATPVQRQEYSPDTFVPEPPATEEERQQGLAAIREIANKLRNRDA